ncbi:hypothetical protein OAA15_00200 [bacterium]|nr:hypothetical protein [bacterium]
MADIPIYPGSSSFTPGDTPFGFYDTDPSFQNEADQVTTWCARRLGYPLVDVELQAINFYTCFEEAVTAYGNEVYQYKIRENYLSLEGNTTGSVLNTEVISPSLGNQIRIAENYGTEAGSGGNTEYYSGSINLDAGVQDYDLTAWSAASASLLPGDSIEVKKLFYEAPPAITRFFDPYAGTGTGMQSMMDTFGFGQYSPGVNFMLMPVYHDLLSMQAIELNDEVRKSAYSFELVNNKLKLFPIPTRDSILFFEYVKKSERDSVIKNADSNGSLISNISNVPYKNPDYGQINAVGRQWVYQYTLALAKEMLGLIRGKYQNVPVPGAEVTLNSADLLSGAIAEKTALLEQLRGTLEETSRKNQLERKSQESEFLNNDLDNVPMLIYIG